MREQTTIRDLHAIVCESVKLVRFQRDYEESQTF